MSSKAQLYILFPAVLAGVVDAAAQERPIHLDTVRVTVASYAAADRASSTRSIEVVTAEEIRRLPATDIAEVLRWMTGVDLMSRSPASADVSLRGSTFEQVVVLVDGVRVTDLQTGHFHLNLTVPLAQVERVEVLRGPASMLHGSGALGGVINIVTRRSGASHARLEGGSFGEAALRVGHSATPAGMSMDLSAEARRSEGHREGTDYETGTARIRLSGMAGPGAFRADLGLSARNFGADRFYANFPSYEETRTATASLAWRVPSGQRLVFEPQIDFRRNSDDFVLIRDRPAFYRNEHATDRTGARVVVAYSASPLLSSAGGIEASIDRLRSGTLGDRNESRVSLFGEVVAGEIGRWSATAGLRADSYDVHGLYWSPAAGGAWWPVPRLKAYASIGSALRAPTWTERYYRDPGNVGDPELKPERAIGAEAGLEATPSSRVRAGVAAFTRRSEDLIDWSKPRGGPAAPWKTQNIQEARFNGIESDLTVEGPLEIRWRARAAWLSIQAVAGDFESKYALRPIVENFGLSVDRMLGSAVQLSMRGSRSLRADDPAGQHALLDGRIGYTRSRVTAALEFRNLTDARYLDIVGAEAPGRSILATLEWTGR